MEDGDPCHTRCSGLRCWVKTLQSGGAGSGAAVKTLDLANNVFDNLHL